MKTPIDLAIEQKQQKIDELLVQRKAAEAKESAAQRAADSAMSILKEHGLDIDDLFDLHSKRIRTWIVKQRGESGTVWSDLRSHFRLHGDKPVSTTAKAGTKEPPLAAGTYHNPYNQQSVDKRTRAPKVLRQWVEQYGLMTVETWRV